MRQIKPGQKVRVGIEVQNRQVLQFFCAVNKVYADRIELSFPESKKQFLKYINEGDDVRLSVYSPVGIILIKSIVLNSPANGEFLVELPADHKRIQRRRYIRAAANYRLIIKYKETPVTALTQDIGGGGVRFLCDVALELKERVEARLFVPDFAHSIPFIGEISVKDHFRENEYLIEFEEITENDRSRIIQKCLQIESAQLREN